MRVIETAMLDQPKPHPMTDVRQYDQDRKTDEFSRMYNKIHKYLEPVLRDEI